ncbi:MAG: hypothetical protein H0T62_01730 [Parachlamydiaceae bacterium]|nr:hypothetical protein [Parachlamydiaceae bacterium]
MKIQMLTPEDIKKLDEDKLRVYRHFLKEEFWPCLQGKDHWDISTAEVFVAVAMTEEDFPVGLALFTFRRSLSWAILLSLSIKFSSSEQDIGKQLLEDVEKFLRDANCYILTYMYSDSDPDFTQINELLKLGGWDAPKLLLVRCHFEGHKFNAPWFKRYVKIPLPEGFEFFPWTKLKPRERELLEHKEKEGVFPSTVSPFHQEKNIEPLNSLGVRHKGDVIGWMITDRLDGDTISYSSFFVEPHHRETTIPLCLVAKSISLQLHSTIEKGVIEMNPILADQSWVTFFKNRFMPSAERIEHIYESCHDLRSEARKLALDADDDYL